VDWEANSSSHTERQGSTEVGISESGGASVKNEDEHVTREDLEVIFKTILENKECSFFQKRLESQVRWIFHFDIFYPFICHYISCIHEIAILFSLFNTSISNFTAS
jgi:hypothetical protein